MLHFFQEIILTLHHIWAPKNLKCLNLDAIVQVQIQWTCQIINITFKKAEELLDYQIKTRVLIVYQMQPCQIKNFL